MMEYTIPVEDYEMGRTIQAPQPLVPSAEGEGIPPEDPVPQPHRGMFWMAKQGLRNWEEMEILERDEREWAVRELWTDHKSSLDHTEWCKAFWIWMWGHVSRYDHIEPLHEGLCVNYRVYTIPIGSAAMWVSHYGDAMRMNLRYDQSWEWENSWGAVLQLDWRVREWARYVLRTQRRKLDRMKDQEAVWMDQMRQHGLSLEPDEFGKEENGDFLQFQDANGNEIEAFGPIFALVHFVG